MARNNNPETSSRKKREPRKLSTTEILAMWYVQNFLEREFDYRGDRQYLKQAKALINPDPDPLTGVVPPRFELEEVQSCLLALKNGTHPGLSKKRYDNIGFHLLWWGEPPYIVQWTQVPERPAVYEHVSYDDWVRRYGRKALDKGLWEGLYLGWSVHHPPESEGVLSFEELVEIVGLEKATASLLNYAEH